MSEEEAFIRAIVDGPGDDTPRLVYADWLDDHSDPRGAYLRTELEWARTRRKKKTVLELAAALDAVWVARVSRPPLGVCCEYLRFVECGPRLTPHKIDEAEKTLGCAFPSAFRAFLLNYNAGKVEPCDPPPSKNVIAVCEAAREFCNLRPEPSGVEEPDTDVVRSTKRLRELAADDHRAEGFPIAGLIALAAPQWDFDAVFLGVGPKEFGKVFFLENLQDHGFDADNLSVIADSLPEFLAKLKPKWVE